VLVLVLVLVRVLVGRRADAPLMLRALSAS
jgi:hypothetical protein